jgi:hypothetical protein
MISFQVNGTMQVLAEKPGMYTCSRTADGDGMALVAHNPIMDIRIVGLKFIDALSVDAECIFTHTIGTVEKKDSITFYLEPAVIAAAILPKAYVSASMPDNPSAADWYEFITNAIAPGVVGSLTEGVTATPI